MDSTIHPEARGFIRWPRFGITVRLCSIAKLAVLAHAVWGRTSRPAEAARRPRSNSPEFPTGSDLAPAWPAWIDQFKLDRRNSKQGDHGRFLRIPLYPVVVRGAGDAAHEAARGHRDGIVRIEVRPAIHAPCARQNQREPVGGIRMRSAHVAGIPSHPAQDRGRGCSSRHRASPFPRYVAGHRSNRST